MSDVWYFADQGGQQGPVNRQDLMAALSRMPNAPDVFVWQPGFSDWKRAGDVTELSVQGFGAPRGPSMQDGAYRDAGGPATGSADSGGIMRLWFGFSGRANRAKYWLVTLANLAIAVVLSGVAAFADLVVISIVTGLVTLALTVSGIAVSIRRLHDRGKSGWWLLLFILGPAVLLGIGAVLIIMLGNPVALYALLAAGFAILIWTFVELGCLRGTIGDNRYGPDPLGGV